MRPGLFFASPGLPSVANGGFAPLCGAAATPVAALKTPVASEGRGEQIKDIRNIRTEVFRQLKEKNNKKSSLLTAVVPSFWKEGAGVVETNTVLTYLYWLSIL